MVYTKPTRASTDIAPTQEQRELTPADGTGDAEDGRINDVTQPVTHTVTKAARGRILTNAKILANTIVGSDCDGSIGPAA